MNNFVQVDPHYQTPEQCAKLAPYADEASQQEMKDSRGCFVLNHDNPDTLRAYNTTGDILRYIEAHRFDKRGPDAADTRVRTAMVQPQDPVAFGLCWKGVPDDNPCANTTTSRAWISLVRHSTAVRGSCP